MTSIEVVDVLLRGANLGLLGLLVLRFLSVRGIGFFEWSIVALAVSMSLYVLVSAPVTQALFAGLGAGFVYLPVITPFLFWWAGLALFDDDFRPRLWHVIPAALVSLPILLVASFLRRLF